MSHNANTNWVKNSVVLYFAVLIGIVIVIAAYLTHQPLYWMLAACVPLVVVAIYIGRLQYVFFKRKFSYRFLPVFANNKIKEADLNPLIGNEQCRKPYNACFFNFETKREQRYPSFGKPVREKQHSYYLADGGRVWQIRPGYAGCRTEQGNFDFEIFRQQSRRSEIKMIELKLSPEVGSFHLVNSSTSQANGTPNIKSMFYDGSAYPVFRDAEAMLLFLKKLRDLSEGKPVGIRLAPDNKKDFYSIGYAICKTEIIPDFIVVEGLSGSSDKPDMFQHHDNGKALYEALLFVDETLRHYGLRSKIKIIASGEISAAFDIFKLLTLEANGVLASKEGDGEKIGTWQNVAKRVYTHKDLCTETLDLFRSFRFKRVSDITVANFFSKLKLTYPETVNMHNNISLFSDMAAKTDTLIVRPFKTKLKNDTAMRFKKVQQGMFFYKLENLS